jgi:hypothetical protein
MSTTTTTTITTDPVLDEHANAIRGLRSRIVSDVAEIGCRLSAVKPIVGHGNWLPWLDTEFGWTEQTALNFIRCHEFVEGLSNSKSVLNLVLSLPVSVVYMLAAPSTPGPVRDEIMERAKNGPVTVAEVKSKIAAAKGCKQPAAKNRVRPAIHREMKLGADTIAKLRGTTLDNAREQDELVVLNRGAAQGELTPVVAKLVADATAGKAVSAITTAANMGKQPPEHDPGPGTDIDPESKGEVERLRIRDEEQENEARRVALNCDEAAVKAHKPKLTETIDRCREAIRAAASKAVKDIDPKHWVRLFNALHGELRDIAVESVAAQPDDGLGIPPFLDRTGTETAETAV